MGKIYQGQSDLTIKLETEKDLTGITIAKIVYKKPSGTIGEFTATVSDAVKGIIEYSVTAPTDIDAPGDWTFWAKITDAQGLISIGEPVIQRIHKVGS